MILGYRFSRNYLINSKRNLHPKKVMHKICQPRLVGRLDRLGRLVPRLLGFLAGKRTPLLGDQRRKSYSRHGGFSGVQGLGGELKSRVKNFNYGGQCPPFELREQPELAVSQKTANFSNQAVVALLPPTVIFPPG
jgi:hypothetical protein